MQQSADCASASAPGSLKRMPSLLGISVKEHEESAAGEGIWIATPWTCCAPTTGSSGICKACRRWSSPGGGVSSTGRRKFQSSRQGVSGASRHCRDVKPASRPGQTGQGGVQSRAVGRLSEWRSGKCTTSSLPEKPPGCLRPAMNHDGKLRDRRSASPTRRGGPRCCCRSPARVHTLSRSPLRPHFSRSLQSAAFVSRS